MCITANLAALIIDYKQTVDKTYTMMTTDNKQSKNRAQSCSTLKKIHNYSYFTDRVIGSGNFSTVYEAFSNATYDKIAAKLVKMSSLTFKKLEELLDQQIQILLTLNHTNVIKCFDILKTSEECYIFTEFCDGGTLDKILKQRGPMNEEQAWPHIKGLFEGLKYLSSKNIIHRDLKPANIFLKGDTVKIADFGFAVQAREKFKDMNIGSPYYMAPEAFIDNIYGSKTDVWSFGIILYEIVHGKTPFSEITDAEGLNKRILIPIKRQDFRPDLSYQLRELILRCLEIDETKRLSVSEIENTYFMRKRNSIKTTPHPEQKRELQLPRTETNTYGSHTVIRIPSRISIKTKDEQTKAKQNSQPESKNYYQLLKIKSYSRFIQDKKTACSSTQTNPESPCVINYRPAVYKTSVYKPKEEVRTISYGGYLRQNNKESSNLSITIK